uniref:Uncharacterized protein n=1 Tax=Cacopsylla melanoneura TaxID=428564 RepID=A0A8D8UPH7_9HEMI
MVCCGRNSVSGQVASHAREVNLDSVFNVEPRVFNMRCQVYAQRFYPWTKIDRSGRSAPRQVAEENVHDTWDYDSERAVNTLLDNTHLQFRKPVDCKPLSFNSSISSCK